MQREHWIGLLTLVTVLTLGAALGSVLGMSPAAGAYGVGLLLALFAWWQARGRLRS